jgi:hypothetical protein
MADFDGRISLRARHAAAFLDLDLKRRRLSQAR